MAEITVRLSRPQDMLLLTLRFSNFVLNGNRLQKEKPAEPALMMAVFQTQSLAEECGTEESLSDGTVKKTAAPMPAKLLPAGESRLVFKVKKETLWLDVNDLLDWNNFEPVVNSRAIENLLNIGGFVLNKGTEQKLSTLALNRDASKLSQQKGLTKDEKNFLKDGLLPAAAKGPIIPLLPVMSKPGDWETALELPFGLFLSPTQTAGWKHLTALRGTNGVLKSTDRLYEMWHSRMGTKTAKGFDEGDLTYDRRRLRILWGIGANAAFQTVPTETGEEMSFSLNSRQRHELVHESSNFNITGFKPQPVTAYKLFLTPLGAYLDSVFSTNGQSLPTGLSVEAWKHLQTLGREHFVEIVEAGYIMPFGHRASLVTITERKPDAGTVTAPNFKRQLVVITQPAKEYNYRKDSNFLSFCLSKVEILTLASPLLPKTKTPIASSISAEGAFLINVKSGTSFQDVIFKIRAEDLAGNVLNFQMPLAFVRKGIADDPLKVQQLVAAYDGTRAAVTAVDLAGQKMSLAPKGGEGDTDFPSYRTVFSAQKNTGEPQGFLPTLKSTEIVEPTLKRLTGLSQKTEVKLEDDNNAGTVFASLKTPLPIDFAGNADKTGGFIKPNFGFSGLSKNSGAFGGSVKEFRDGPEAGKMPSYFTDTGSSDLPRLFGAFQLSEILDLAGDFRSKLPKITTQETADTLTTAYKLETDLAKATPAGGIATFSPQKPNGGLRITTSIVVNKNNPTSTAFSTDAHIDDFNVELAGLMAVQFLELSFIALSGKSADVSVLMKDPALQFLGPLSFLNAFQALIPTDGFSDPPYLDVSTTGVKCGYTLGFPSLQLGAFTLSNISLGASVNLPFTGAAMSLGFAFCEKQQPFTLTVSALGGGGYFGFEVDLHGLRQIDAALEFGAAVGLNLGVASGAVSIMAGIYFKMTLKSDGNNSTELTGYLRINGAMSIIGLITATVELYMAFTYIVDQHKAKGEASVSIKVHVLFFSKKVTVHTTRTFSGNGSDPNFQMAYAPDDKTGKSSAEWSVYCDAFAA